MRKRLTAIIVIFIAVLGMGIPVAAQAKATTITVKKADTATAKRLDRQLRKGKKFQIKVKGNPKAAKKLLNKVNKKLQKVNCYSVLMQSGQGKTSKGYTLFKVSADNAKLYTYTIALLKDMHVNSFNVAIQKQEEEVEIHEHDLERRCGEVQEELEELWEALTEACRFEEMDEDTIGKIAGIEKTAEDIFGEIIFDRDSGAAWKLFDPYSGNRERIERVSKCILDSENELKRLKAFPEDEDEDAFITVYLDFCKGNNRLRKMQTQKNKAASEKFCNLSTCLQAQIITEKFNHYRYEYMSYSRERMKPSSRAGWIKSLLNRKAKGICMDFVSSQMLIFNQIGIPSYCTICFAEDHDLVTVKVKNESKKTMWLCSDYGRIYRFRDVKAKSKSIYKKANKNWRIMPSDKKVDIDKINKEAYKSSWTYDDLDFPNYD